MSSDPYNDRHGAASRRRQIEIVKHTSKPVDSDDEEYQTRRAEMNILRIYARRYPKLTLELADAIAKSA